MSHVINNIQRLSPELVGKYQGLSTATVHEASGGKGALSSRIKPVFPAMRVCGPAVTVKVRPGDNLLLHKAIYVAQPGDVIGDPESRDLLFGQMLLQPRHLVLKNLLAEPEE